MKRWIIGTLAVALALAASTSMAVAQEEPAAPATATVEVTVWRSVANPANLYVSTRPDDGRWRRVTTPLDLSALHASGRYHQSNAATARPCATRRPSARTVGMKQTSTSTPCARKNRRSSIATTTIPR